MNKKKDCIIASFKHYKKSDITELCAGAKILIALIREQPLARIDLCKKAGIDTSTFNRYRRLLHNIGIMKKTSNGSYCLYDYEDQPSYWHRIQQKCLKAGGPLIDLKVRKLVLGDQDLVTGWYETDYDTVVSIRGIVIHKGAIELRAAVSDLVPTSGDYSAILLTEDPLDEGDHLKHGDDLYNVAEVDAIIDGNTFSFWVAKLIIIPQ